jgi:7,8-dihydroneopterin 2',3'-cyclic phosphate phosphodiesterase
LHPELKKAVSKIHDKSLREKVMDFLSNPTVEIEGKVYSGLSLDTSPAGLSRHHSYQGGFVEHVVATTDIALTLCKVAKKVYHGKIDQDLIIAGCILHDIFKPLEYTEREDGTYGLTPLAERLDHLTLIVAELIKRGFPLDLVHIMASHMGWQNSPIGPRTIEALIVHLADSADSQLNGETLRAARYLSRQATGIELEKLTAKEAFEIVNAKTAQGWDGVQKTVGQIRKKRQLTQH